MFLTRASFSGLVWFGKNAKIRKMTQARKQNIQKQLKAQENVDYLISRPFVTSSQEIRGIHQIPSPAMLLSSQELLALSHMKKRK